jgi:hypothetical protein
MHNKFTIIIPTMWYAAELKNMLMHYLASPQIGQVIIINNNKSHTPRYISKLNNPKALVLTPEKNIFVNPAWNLGAAHANHTIILANDDISIINLENLLQKLAQCPFDMVGATVNNTLSSTNEIRPLKPGSEFPRRSFGCFMMLRNYTYIPEQILIYSGDVLLFKMAKSPGIISGNYIHTPISTTIRKRPDIKLLGQKDVMHLRHLLLSASDRSKLNIVIRTSGRPNYFENCIQSIRKYAPKALLHITIDNAADLEYVQKSCEGLKFNYYLINRETVKQHCSKIKIRRKSFIFNHYFNIVKPFLNGYVIFLDDDDQLMMTPETGFDSSVFYLHKVNISGRIIPDEKHWQTITLNNISGLSVLFHSDVMPQWKPQRGGDFDFISTLASHSKPIWKDTILSSTQTGGNNGRRNDLPSINN